MYGIAGVTPIPQRFLGPLGGNLALMHIPLLPLAAARAGRGGSTEIPTFTDLEPASGPDPPLPACSIALPSWSIWERDAPMRKSVPAGFWHRFVPCSQRGCRLARTPGQSPARDPLPGPALDANCTSVATAVDGDSSILAALIKLQKLCMLSVMRRPFINSVIKAIKHDPLVLTSLMAG